MNQKEMDGMVGKTLSIRGTTHLCLASGRDALLLLQLAKRDEALFKKDDPVQYIVAHGPHWDGDDLVWRQGEYFPLLGYRATDAMPVSVRALRDAIERMTETL